jgi:hypothetical protein
LILIRLEWETSIPIPRLAAAQLMPKMGSTSRPVMMLAATPTPVAADAVAVSPDRQGTLVNCPRTVVDGSGPNRASVKLTD